MPDRKKKPYHPRHFPDPKDPASVGGFVVAANNEEYAFYHSGTSQDAALLNGLPRPACPYCGSPRAESKGVTGSGARRWICRTCGKTFTPATGGLLSCHKLPVKTLVRFLVNVLADASVNEASKVAKISMRTAVYWLNKAFLALRGYQDSLVLSGTVYIDDKLIDVEASRKGKDRGGVPARDRRRPCVPPRRGRLPREGMERKRDTRSLIKSWGALGWARRGSCRRTLVRFPW